ncbi:MAG: YcaO-like family protein, partial [Actinobacteria bacterium]|nr:YcaO-like family protein [Actinomycetota bacterium]
MNWSTTKWAELLALPFRSRRQVSRGFPEWTIAQHGVFASLAEERFSVIGSACARDSEAAHTTSLFEAIERLLTRVAAHSEDRWLDAEQGGGEQISPVRIRLFQVLPRPDRQSTRITDGTGLAVHTDYNAARNHAVAELLERTLLSQLWYRVGLPLQPVSPPLYRDHCQARTWVLGGGKVWFALADAVDHSLPAYSLGAAVRDNRDSAVTHSLSEAVMLLDSAQGGASPPHVQDLARKRASSLVGPLALRRREHLDRMIGRAQSTDVQKLTNLWLHAQIQPQDVTVARLLTGPD